MLAFVFRLLLVPAVLGTLTGCALKRDAATTATTATSATAAKVPIVAPAPGEAERIGAAGDEFNPRVSQWAEQGHYKDILTAARLRLKNDPGHVGAQYALAHSLYYNGDFAGAAVEAQKLVQHPQYQNDAQANEMLDDARALAKRYAGQTFAPVVWVENDVDETSDKWRAHGASLIAAGQYDEIERTAAGLTQTPVLMSDGGWTLAPFWVGLWQDGEGEAAWQKAHAQVEKWAAARPQSPLARVTLARSWTSGAWIARGDEFANKVSDQTWKTVEERQAQAAPLIRNLLNAPQASSPLVYGSAQRYGRLGGAPRDWQDKVFERGVAQFPGYTDFHRERSALLLPRWDGAPGEWEAEAARAADAEAARTKDDAAGDRLYARIVWSQWDYHKNMQQQTRVDWPRTKRGFDAILAQHPGSLAASTIYLRLCHQYKDYGAARQVLPIIAGRADSANWNSPAHFAQTRNWILKMP